MAKAEVSSRGPGWSVLVFAVFLVLKLTGVIHWSWWWVTAPLWVGLAFAVLLFTVIFVSVFASSVSRSRW